MSANAYVQRDQPPGVPPLSLTGERTLPDVPAENYWYRRHLIVYEWIARRVAGQRVLDMACGEGYGSAVLAGSAASVVGLDANPEAHEHARLRYGGGNLSFQRGLVETYGAPGQFDAVVAMYHDQGLAPLKMIAFNSGVNWTLGLPFVRTSPDHGTAYDIAGKGAADPSSMRAAIRLAKQLAFHPRNV